MMYAITNAQGQVLLDNYGEVVLCDDAMTAQYVADVLMIVDARIIRWDPEVDSDDVLEVV